MSTNSGSGVGLDSEDCENKANLCPPPAPSPLKIPAIATAAWLPTFWVFLETNEQIRSTSLGSPHSILPTGAPRSITLRPCCTLQSLKELLQKLSSRDFLYQTIQWWGPGFLIFIMFYSWFCQVWSCVIWATEWQSLDSCVSKRNMMSILTRICLGWFIFHGVTCLDCHVPANVLFSQYWMFFP